MIVVRELARPDVLPQLDDVIEVYTAAYGERWDGRYWSRANFVAWFGRHLVTQPVRMFVACDGDVLVGWIYGFRLPPDTGWWDRLEGRLPEAVAAATAAGRVEFFTEFVVLPPYRQQGIGTRLYRALSETWTEADYATMAVLTDNDGARRLYDRWGWRVIGHKAPTQDLPRMEARILRLSHRT